MQFFLVNQIQRSEPTLLMWIIIISLRLFFFENDSFDFHMTWKAHNFYLTNFPKESSFYGSSEKGSLFTILTSKIEF